MRNLIRLYDYSKQDILDIFHIADDLIAGKYKDFLKGKTVVMFFPNTSVRTRVTFERGIYLLGGQTILFPPETLDKKENLKDVIGYLNNWADEIIIRHNNIGILDEISNYVKMTVINAMTDINHPCEILTDLYSLSKIRSNIEHDKFLFMGAKGNIGLTWKEAAEIFGFQLYQCCPENYDIENVEIIRNIEEAIKGIDIICTDSIPSKSIDDFKDYNITTRLMDKANKNAILNPCPPFYRNEVVSEDVLNSDYFIGYSFKKYLLEIQQAIMIFNILH